MNEGCSQRVGGGGQDVGKGLSSKWNQRTSKVLVTTHRNFAGSLVVDMQHNQCKKHLDH